MKTLSPAEARSLIAVADGRVICVYRGTSVTYRGPINMSPGVFHRLAIRGLITAEQPILGAPVEATRKNPVHVKQKLTDAGKAAIQPNVKILNKHLVPILVASIEGLLADAGYKHMTDEELEAEIAKGNQTVVSILRARLALAAAKAVRL